MCIRDRINGFVHPEKLVILFDEIDAIALDRTNMNDLREMGRATSTLLKYLDRVDERIVLIATTNLFEHFDKALIRRFDSVIDFNRYSQEDLMDISEEYLNRFLVKFNLAKKDIRLFRKIMKLISPLPYPGDLKNLIKTAVAVSYTHLFDNSRGGKNNVYQSVEDNFVMGNAYMGNAVLGLFSILYSGNYCSVADTFIFPILFDIWHGVEPVSYTHLHYPIRQFRI